MLYILDEPSIGLHQRDNDRLIDDARAAARPRQHRARRRARRADDARGRLARRHGAGRRRARRPRRRRGHGRRGRSGTQGSITGQFLSRQARRSRCRTRRAAGQRLVRRARRAHAQPEGHRRRVPGRRTSSASPACPGSGKSTLVNEIVYKALANRLHQLARQAGRARLGRGHRVLRQGDRDRPDADRPHAALEPGHVHRSLHAHPRALLADAGGEGARLQAGAVLVQRARRPLRDVQGRRPDQDRDALPAGRLRAVRDVPRQALQPRDARGALQGQVDRGRARDVRRGGAASSSPRSRSSAGGCRRCTTSGSTTSSSASRRRRSRAARRSA